MILVVVGRIQQRYGVNEKDDAFNHAHMRAQGALLTAFRVRACTIEGVTAKVKYVLEFETQVGENEDLETWWYTHEWLDELRSDLDEVRVDGRARVSS